MGHICSCVRKTEDIQSCNLSQKQFQTNDSKDDISNVIQKSNLGNVNGYNSNANSRMNNADPQRDFRLRISKCIKGFLFRKNKWFRLEGQLLQYQSDLYEAFVKQYAISLPSELPTYIVDGWKDYYKEIPFNIRKISPLFIDRIMFKYNDTTSNRYDRALMTIDELAHCAISVYKGSIDLLQNKHGEGVLMTNEGIEYKGTWVNNQFTGWNQIIDPQGYMYIGNYVNGKLEGKGEKYLFNANNNKDDNSNSNGNTIGDGALIYRGDFVNGLKQGHGTEVLKGKIFVGEFKNDFKLRGKLSFDSGDVYEGEFKDNSFNGQGHYTWKHNGHEYVGEYKNDKFNGEGLYRWSENEYYKGGYRNGLKQGQGELYTKNGSVVYIGPFENGEMHGEGTYKCGNYNGSAEFINGHLNKNYVPKKKNIFQKLYKKQQSVIVERKKKDNSN